jgi:hypothetical protein
LDSGLDQKLPGKVDVGVSLIGWFNGAVKAQLWQLLDLELTKTFRMIM